MNGYWPRVPIERTCLGLFDGPHATPRPSDSGPVFLGIKNITEDGRLDLSEVRHIAEEDFGTWTRRVLPQPDDIVFTYEATLNRYAIIPQGFRGCLGRRLALIRPNPEVVDPRFLYYSFFGSEWRQTIAQNTLVGSTVDRVPLTTFPTFPIALPPLATQRKIASILSAYDDLIENNTRRIAILEEMAQALYREWFVHFRYPGHEHVPLVDSGTELGAVPEGWDVGVMADVAQIGRDSLNPAKFPGEDFSHYSFPAYDDVELPTLERGDTIKSNKFCVPHGSVLLSKLNPRIPRVWLPFLDGAARPIASTEFLIIMPREPATPSFLYLMFKSSEFQDLFTGRSLGTSTSHQRVKPQDFLNLTTVVPAANVLTNFESVALDITRLMYSLRVKNDRLRQTRNLLLPKLISGEVNVVDAT